MLDIYLNLEHWRIDSTRMSAAGDAQQSAVLQSLLLELLCNIHQRPWGDCRWRASLLTVRCPLYSCHAMLTRIAAWLGILHDDQQCGIERRLHTRAMLDDTVPEGSVCVLESRRVSRVHIRPDELWQ